MASSIWQSFLPQHVIQDLLAHPGQPATGRGQKFQAVVLFADVSGFTAISERLGAVGKSGTEELTTLLNSYFDPMIALIHSFGGIIGKFGGDAMTVFFPCEPETRARVARQAVRCALDMQAKMGAYAALQTSVGVYGLAMKAGLAEGPIFCTTVGDPALRLEYIIAGPPLDLCAEAEHHAVQGEVVVHRGLCEAAENLALVKTEGDFSWVNGVGGTRGESPPQAFPYPESLPDEALQTIAAFMHPSIAQRLRDDQLSFLNEHRKVTVLFGNFAALHNPLTALDYENDPQAGPLSTELSTDYEGRLQNYLTQVIHIVAHYDGYLNKVDMGDKGSKYLVSFGAPIAHEDDPARALRCALELAAIPESQVRIGIHTGFVFSGQVGSQQRQEYTVMGDAVNLSARLMQAAQPGEMLASEFTHTEAGPRFTWDPRGSLQVKGKSQPIPIYALSGLSRQARLSLLEDKHGLPLVGRTAELALLEQKLAQALRGQGQIVGLTAKAGMGKSRLAAEVIEAALEAGMALYVGEGMSHATHTSYHLWSTVLRSFFALDPAASPEQQTRALTRTLEAISPLLVPRLPLLGLALNLPIPENDLTRSLEGRLRKESLEALVVEIVRHRAQAQPILLVFEDSHWSDPLSTDLLNVVGRSLLDLPVLMLVVYRTPEAEGWWALQLTPASHFTEIRLGEFTSKEVGRLVRLKLVELYGTAEYLTKELVNRIDERAQGNPFYVTEMVNLLHDRGIAPNDVTALDTFDLPDSLHSLIISRIDQLAEEAKSTLKVACVIGRLFRAMWLWGIYPQLGTPEEVKAQLIELSSLDIGPVDASEPELDYLFKHIVTREVAYQSLALATQQMLHEQTARFIEANYASQRNSYLDLLAYHYGLSQNRAKQKEYFALAGKAAQAAYANNTAIDYYQRLLPLLTPAERGEVELDLGEIYRLIGQWADSETSYLEAYKLAETNQQTRLQASVEFALGGLLRARGTYAEATQWLERAQARFTELGEPAGASNALREIGIIHWVQGNYEAALSRFEQCKAISSEAGDRRGFFRAVGNIGLIYRSLRNFEKALENYTTALKIAGETGDLLGESMILGNMGNIYLEQGDFAKALHHYIENLQLALSLGYRQGASIAVGNMGMVHHYRGDPAGALLCFTYNLRITLDLGDLEGIAFSLHLMALANMEMARFDAAEPLLERAIQLTRELDIPFDLATFLLTKMAFQVALNQYAEALATVREALEIGREIHHEVVVLEGQVAEIRLRYLLGELSMAEAVATFQELLTQLLDGHEDDLIMAQVAYEIWRVDPHQDEFREKAARLYREMYTFKPEHEYKRRFSELTGEDLPDPEPLPPLPEIVTRAALRVETLLAQFDRRS